MSGRLVKVQSDAIYAITGWSTPSVYDYIAEWFSAGGWSVQEPHSMRFNLSGDQLARLEMTFWVDDAYSEQDVHNNFAEKIQSITFYNPLYGSTKLVNMLVGISVDDPNGANYPRTPPPVISSTPKPVKPAHTNANIFGSQPQDTATGTQNNIINIEDALKNFNPFAKWDEWSLSTFGFTTPALILTGVVLALVVPNLLDRRR